MLAPKSDEECVGLSPEKAAERKALRARFKSSGLYEKGDPAQLKWGLAQDWFANQVLVANDGESVVRMGPWANNFTDEAFSFIRNGTVVRKVAINELVKDERSVKRTVSHFTWSDSHGLTSDGSRFFVNTFEGFEYLFDVKTGELVSSTTLKASVNAPSEGDSSNRTCSLALFFIGALAVFGRRPR